MSRYGFVRHPESVALVVVDAAELVLVRQTRPGAAGTTLEVPGGTIEEGETPDQTAVPPSLLKAGAGLNRSAVRCGSFQ